jgi:hypothetical protein
MYAAVLLWTHGTGVGRESTVAFTSAPKSTAAAKRYRYTSTTMAALPYVTPWCYTVERANGNATETSAHSAAASGGAGDRRQRPCKPPTTGHQQHEELVPLEPTRCLGSELEMSTRAQTPTARSCIISRGHRQRMTGASLRRSENSALSAARRLADQTFARAAGNRSSPVTPYES